MNARKWEEQLSEEGFNQVFTWRDGPHVFYPDHTHTHLTAHFILDGEMTLTSGGNTRTYKAGDRCDVPAGEVHSARMGPSGCTYIVGEK
jgi:quercetin dioxygenase-like cupin family protein